MSADHEKRLIRLEENHYFLDERLGRLDAQITEQQRQLDALAASMRQMAASLEEIRAFLAGGQKTGATRDSPPPHHEPRLW